MLLKARAINLLLTAVISTVLIPEAAAHGEFSPKAVTSADRARLDGPPARLRRIRYSAPEYPSKARDQRLSGHVTIDFIVNAKGDPTELRIVEAQPARIFDRAALEAVKRWRYMPFTVDGVRTDATRRAIVYFEAFTETSTGR